MLVVRRATFDDLAAIERLALGVGAGMTSLPRDRHSLERRLERSHESFAAPPEERLSRCAGEDLFFFVLEDGASGKVVGTSAVKTGIGLEEPFYSYRLGTVVHASRELGVHQVIPTLYLTNDYTGCAEIGSLLLDPGYRGGGMGKLLSRCRFLFLAEHLVGFPDKVIAEMRGVSDDRGRSPFWEGLGRHFFSMEFSRADYLTGTRGKTFIAELMPRNPIYVPLLPSAAQEVIGRVHEQTRPALGMLEAEGFHYEGYVDIFDGGPTVEARTAGIRAVRESRRRTVVEEPFGGAARQLLLSNRRWEGFRACIAEAEMAGSRVRLTAAVREALDVAPGGSVRVVPLVGASVRHVVQPSG